MKLYSLSTLLATFALITIFFQIATAQKKRYVYEGPDGCSDDTCDCSVSTTEELDKNGKLILMTQKYSCNEHNPIGGINLPPAVTDFCNEVRSGFDQVVERTKGAYRTASDRISNWKLGEKAADVKNWAGETISGWKLDEKVENVKKWAAGVASNAKESVRRGANYSKEKANELWNSLRKQPV